LGRGRNAPEVLLKGVKKGKKKKPGGREEEKGRPQFARKERGWIKTKTQHFPSPLCRCAKRRESNAPWREGKKKKGKMIGAP